MSDLDYANMNDAELLQVCGDSAANWAAAFIEIVEANALDIDFELMVGWFANAIEASSSKRKKP